MYVYVYIILCYYYVCHIILYYCLNKPQYIILCHIILYTTVLDIPIYSRIYIHTHVVAQKGN